ncbi:MAG: cellulase family glycosylhydrolase [Ferruginibacter sp.]
MRIILLFFLLFPLLLQSQTKRLFVKTNRTQFSLNGKSYYFIGANYWYGGLLALQKDPQKGKARLIYELDFMRSNGVSNLRVLVGAEGTGPINGVKRVSPALQPKKGGFNEDVLKGLDLLLTEMAKRDMKAVLYLSNNWEWSGGFLQYLNWNGLLADSTLQRKPGWDELRDQVSMFYSCGSCKSDYEHQLRYVLKHKNIYSGISYINEPAIMSWEIANEPRPMRPGAIEDYKKWISSITSIIRSIDKNHLITIGTEGIIGTENSKELYTAIHTQSAIDYLTIHIWPKNWGWYADTSIAAAMPVIIQKTKEYIDDHERIALQINKPLVIEEFGLPRDQQSFSSESPVTSRNTYYKFILEEHKRSVKNKGPIAGINFWAFSGSARPIPGQLFWKEGNDLMGDPPQEEQGINSVFDCDRTTWALIKKYTKLLKKK